MFRPARLLLCTTAALALAGPAAGDAFGAQIAIQGARVQEGNAGTKMLEYTIVLSGGFNSSSTYTIDWDTVEDGAGQGTATPNIDYTPVSGRLQWPGSGSPPKIQVPILGDTVHEADENIYVALSNPHKIDTAQDTFFTLPTIGTPAFGFIDDDDPVVASPLTGTGNPTTTNPTTPGNTTPTNPAQVTPIIINNPGHASNPVQPVIQPVVQPVIQPPAPQPQQAPIIINSTTPQGANAAALPAPAPAPAPAPVSSGIVSIGDSIAGDEQPTRRLAVDFLGIRRGAARVEVSCDGSLDCAGRVKVKARIDGVRVTLASRAYDLESGDSHVVRVRLSNAARAALAHAGHGTVVVTYGSRSKSESFSV